MVVKNLNKGITELCYLTHAFLWTAFLFIPFRIMLKQRHNLKNLRLYEFWKWRMGAFYFVGSIDMEQVFVKTDFFHGILRNEATFYNFIREHPTVKISTPNFLFYSDSPVRYLGVEFKSWVTLENFLKSKEPTYSEQIVIADHLCKIIDNFYSLKIVHRDFNLRNLLVSDQLEICVFDFLFAVSTDGSIKSINRPRTLFSSKVLDVLGVQKTRRVWDDAFSVYHSLFSLMKSTGYNLTYITNQVSNRIGRLEYSDQF